MADTPPGHQLIEYRLDELDKKMDRMLEHMDGFNTSFNNHMREDAILAEKLKLFEEDRKAAVGFWGGIGGAITGAGAVVYSLFSGGK